MADLPNFLKLEVNSRHYLFFQFTIVIYNKMLFGTLFKPKALNENFITSFNFKNYNKLQALFNIDEWYNNTSIDLSLQDVLSLLSIVNIVAIELLDNQALTFDSNDSAKANESGKASHTLKSFVIETFPNISREWDLDYLKSAQVFFEEYKKRFKNFPQLMDILKTVTGQSRVQ